MDSEIMDGMHPVFRFGLSSVNLKWTTTIRMAPGFMKGMKRLLTRGNSDKTDKKKTASSTKSTPEASPGGRSLTSQQTSSPSTLPVRTGRQQDQESFSLRQDISSPAPSPPTVLQGSYHSPQPSVPQRSLSMEPDALPNGSSLWSGTPAPTQAQMQSLLTAPAVADPRAMQAALRHSGSRHGFQERGRSSRRESGSGRAPQPGSSGRPTATAAQQYGLAGDLEIPNQESKIGPPPSSAGRQPHSSATSRVPSHPGRRGDQARGMGQKDPYGHLLTDMEGFAHPHSGPVYHHSPVRPSASSKQRHELRRATPSSLTRTSVPLPPAPAMSASAESYLDTMPSELLWRMQQEPNQGRSQQSQLRDPAKDYPRRSRDPQLHRGEPPAVHQVYRQGNAMDNIVDAVHNLETGSVEGGSNSPGTVTPAPERETHRAPRDSDSWNSVTPHSSVTPKSNSHKSFSTHSTQRSNPQHVEHEPRWQEMIPESNFPDVPGPDPRWADLMLPALQSQEHTSHRGRSEPPRTASNGSGWYTRDGGGGRREAVEAERMHNQQSQHASERSRAGHPPRAPTAEQHYVQDPVLQAQILQAYAANFHLSKHLGHHSVETAADRNPGQHTSSSQYHHRPASAGYSEQEIVEQAIDFFGPGSLASGDGRTTSLPVARNAEWQRDFGQRHASYDGQGAGGHDAFHPEPHDHWAALKDLRLRSPDEARAAAIMNELKELKEAQIRDMHKQRAARSGLHTVPYPSQDPSYQLAFGTPAQRPRSAEAQPDYWTRNPAEDGHHDWQETRLWLEQPPEMAEYEIYTPSAQEAAPRRMTYSPPVPAEQSQTAVESITKQIQDLQSRLKAATDAQAAAKLAPNPTSIESSQHSNASELSELRRVNTFLQTKLADVEHELHATREQNLALQTKRSTAQEELAELASRFDAAESSKAELVTLVDELRGNLERAMAEKGSELEQVQTDLEAAQAEATAQEELAELAKGELDEYKRHMAAEVEHARQEAIKMMRVEHGDAGQLHGEVERAAANAARARQERDSLCDMLAVSSQKRADLEDQVHSLETELAIQKESMAALEQRLAELEEERARLEIAKEEAEELAEDRAAELEEGRARLEAAEGELADMEKERARMAAALGAAEGDRRELATLRERVARLNAANAALEDVLREAKTDPASKSPEDEAAGHTSQGFSDLVDESVFDMADMDRNSADFEVGSFDLTDGQFSTVRRPLPQPDGSAPSASAAARRAAEEKAELLAEVSEMRYRMGSTNQELARLQEIEGLADDALKALEAQTKEAARLRAHAAGLEEALNNKQGQLAEAVRRQAVLEDAIGDRDSQVFENGKLWPTAEAAAGADMQPGAHARIKLQPVGGGEYAPGAAARQTASALLK